VCMCVCVCAKPRETNKMFLIIKMQGTQATTSTNVINLAHKLHHKPNNKLLSYCYKNAKLQKHHKTADKTLFIISSLLNEIQSLYTHLTSITV